MDHWTNFGIAMTLGVLTYIIIFNVFVWPIEEEQRNKLIAEYCPDGLENCSLTIDGSILVLLPIMPALGINFIALHFLEKRRMKQRNEKTWSSYK